MKDKRIFAEFTGDFTGFKKKIDCTNEIKKLSIKALRDLLDNDLTSDSLASEDLIEEARFCFTEEWGKGTKDTQFGFEVTVVDSILAYFEVESLNQIKKCKVCGELESEKKLKEHVMGHNPNSSKIDLVDVQNQFEG